MFIVLWHSCWKWVPIIQNALKNGPKKRVNKFSSFLTIYSIEKHGTYNPSKNEINEPTELCCKESWEKVLNLSIFLTPLWIATENLAETAHCPALFNQLLGDFWQLNVCQGGEVTFHPNGTSNGVTEKLRMRPISSPLENLPVDAGLDKDCLSSKFSVFAPSTHPFESVLGTHYTLAVLMCKGEPICATLLRK